MKIKHEKEEMKNEKALGANSKECKQQCRKCGKFCHKPGNKRCLENKNKKEENKKTERYENKIENLMECATIAHMSKDSWAWNYGHKKIEKAEEANDSNEDDVVLCLLTTKSKNECKKKKVWFVDVKQPLEAGMMCTIDGDTFLFMKNTWIGDSGASCHITNNDTDSFDITNIHDSIQGSSSIMPTAKVSKMGSQCDCMDPYTMACDVLPQGRYKPVFPDLLTLTKKQDCM